jgi:hypothetical protein
VKLLGKLPNPEKDDGSARNGLSTPSVRDRVLSVRPPAPLLAIVELHLARVTEHVEEGGWRDPALVVHRIEVASPEDEHRVQALLDEFAERRTGRQAALFAADATSVTIDATSAAAITRNGLRAVNALPDDEPDDDLDDAEFEPGDDL